MFYFNVIEKCEIKKGRESKLDPRESGGILINGQVGQGNSVMEVRLLSILVAVSA